MKMQTPSTGLTTDSLPAAQDIPIEHLVAEVYQSSAPVEKQRIVSQLVGKVYEVAPPHERSRLIAQLMQPLGILSLLAVANGVFAKIRFQGDLSDMSARVEEVKNIRASEVVALANFAQQVSLHAVDGLASILMTSPVLTSSAAAMVLARILVERMRSRRQTDRVA
jgi:hypothetical protein